MKGVFEFGVEKEPKNEEDPKDEEEEVEEEEEEEEVEMQSVTLHYPECIEREGDCIMQSILDEVRTYMVLTYDLSIQVKNIKLLGSSLEKNLLLTTMYHYFQVWYHDYPKKKNFLLSHFVFAYLFDGDDMRFGERLELLWNNNF